MTDYISREAVLSAIWKASAEHDLFFPAFILDAIEDIPAADVRPKWISVEERLPEEPGEYIVFIRDPFYGKDEPQDEFNVDASYVTSCFYDKDAGLWKEWADSYYCANLDGVNTEKTYYVSHWMPMPDKPEKETP